jgi:hypothetical protein
MLDRQEALRSLRKILPHGRVESILRGVGKWTFTTRLPLFVTSVSDRQASNCVLTANEQGMMSQGSRIGRFDTSAHIAEPGQSVQNTCSR